MPAPRKEENMATKTAVAAPSDYPSVEALNNLLYKGSNLPLQGSEKRMKDSTMVGNVSGKVLVEQFNGLFHEETSVPGIGSRKYSAFISQLNENLAAPSYQKHVE